MSGKMRIAVFLCLLVALAAVGGWWYFRLPEVPKIVEEDSDPTRRVERFALADSARRAALAEDWSGGRKALDQLAAMEREVLGEVQPDTHMQRGRLEREAGNVSAAREALEHASGAGGWREVEAKALLAAADADTRLLRAAARHFEAGDYQQAISCAGEAHKGLLEGPDRAAAAFWWGLASLERAEAFGEARGRLEQARAEIQSTFGKDHPLGAECLCGVARFDQERGQFMPAELAYKQALQQIEATLGAETPQYARVQRRLAHLYSAWWIADAQGLCLQVLHLRSQVVGTQHPDYAESLVDLARINLNFLQEDRAVELLTSAITLLESGRGPDHPALIEPLTLLGRAHASQGAFSQARLAYRRSLRISERTHGKHHPAHARTLVYFADLVGNPECDDNRAQRLLAEASNAYRTQGCTLHPDYAYTLLQEANMHQGATHAHAQRDLARARQLVAESFNTFERIPAGTLLPWYVLANARASISGYWDDYRSLSINDAERYVSRAEEAIRTQQGTRDERWHPFYVLTMNARLRTHLARGEFDRAIETGQKMVEVLRARHGDRLNYHTMSMECLLALTLLRSGRTEEAMPCIEVTLRRVGLMSRELDGQAESSRLAFVTYHAQVLSIALTAQGTLKRKLRPEEVEKIYNSTLEYRGLVGARQTEERAVLDRPHLKPLLASLQQIRHALLIHLLEPPAEEARASWVEELSRLTDVKEDLEAELAQQCKPVTPQKGQRALTLEEVQKQLPTDAVLIDFLHYVRLQEPPAGRVVLLREPHLAAFVVRREGTPALIDIGPVAPIQQAIDAWRAALDGQPNSPDLDEAGLRLAHLIWVPLTEHLGPARTVLIAPEGPLCALPFAALPGNQPGSSLIDDYAIGYVPSSRWLVDRAQRIEGQTQGLLAIGDIRYGQPASLTGNTRRSGLLGDAFWEDLPATKRETEETQKLFRANQRGQIEVVRDRVTRSNLLDALTKRFRHIHFAGHGYFADEQASKRLAFGQGGSNGSENGLSPLERQLLSRNQQVLSGLVLSDGLLTAEEVGGLDLRGTQLVVLSACDTGLGHVANNEGTLGLHRAFLNAGVGSVVSSLWKVDDAATATLMHEFYRNVWERKVPRLEALRLAQQTLRQDPRFGRHVKTAEVKRGPKLKPLPLGETPSTNKRSAHPAFWAAFVLGGHWD